MSFFEEISAFPTVILTICFLVTSFYWLLMFVGIFDLDLLEGSDGADGADGAIDGGLDAADVGDVGDVGDAGDAGDVGDAEGALDAPGLLGVLGLRRAPLTVSLSILILWAWTICFLIMHWGRPVVGEGAGYWLLSAGALAGGLVGGTALASLCVRPLARLFHRDKGMQSKELVGKLCTITTGHVDESFGQAKLLEGGDAFVVSVRCEPDRLKRGDKALIVDWDGRSSTYRLEPVEEALLLEDSTGEDG